jgi:hypothetical protein
MPDEPRGRSAEGRIQQVGPENGRDRATPEEVAEPARKPSTADAEWLSMASADPAHFLKDLSPE